ncbi:MAG: hypothetical protein AMJ81_06860 [Phycisphaerae bacterium SM23_33]|nr:MAG: hypothetical protein AMJ81_06860 [Phycisphaerae bacterium SM23_33]
MMLAGPADYIRLWQFPLLAVYLAGWLIAGPYLTQRALRRFAQLPRSKSSTARAAKINAVAGGVALLAAGALTIFLLTLSVKVGPRWLVVIGPMLVPFVMVGMSWLVHLAALNVSTKAALRITASTAVPLILLLAIIGTAAFVPAWYLRQAEVKEAFCRGNLQILGTALVEYQRVFVGQATRAPNLQVLVDTGFVEAKHLTCPARKDQKGAYLYVPSDKVPPASQKIWVCDRYGNHRGRRSVLFNDERILLLREGEFQQLLALPENAALRKMLAAGG